MRNVFRFLTVVLALASVVSIIGCSSGSQGGMSNNAEAVQMMKMLSENISDFTYMDVYKIRTDEKLASIKGLLDEESIHLIPFDLFDECEGLAFAMDNGLCLAKMSISLDSMIERESTGMYEYGGFSVWTSQYSSTILIEGIYVFGDDEDIRACIDIVNGQTGSLYNKMEDVVDRLPDSFSLSTWVVDNEYHLEDGLLMQAFSDSIQGENSIHTEIYKFNSLDAAQQYNDFSGSYYDEYANPDVTRDGVFVTAVTTSTGFAY